MDNSFFSDKELRTNSELAHTEIVIAALFLTLTWTVVGLRFWVRSHMLHSTGADDWLVLFSQLFFTSYCAVQLEILHLIPGIDPATYPALKLATNWFITGTSLYAWAMITLKLSLGAFFLRIITSKWQRGVVCTVMVSATIANLIECFYLIFMCGDPHTFVENIILDKCAPVISMAFVAYGQNTVNTLTDITLALLPILILWRTNMKRGQKWTVGLILTLATAGCISSIVRFVYVPGILHPKSIAFYKTIKPLTIICIVEMGSGILACSLATLRPLLATLVDFRTIRYSISRITSRSHDNTGRSSAMAVQKEYKEYNSDPVSSQDSELYEIQHARIASMKESFFSDADSQTGVFPERREKNLSVQPRRFDEGSEINLV